MHLVRSPQSERISALESLDVSPLFLGGPPSVISGHRLRRFYLQLHRFARFPSFFTFFVEPRGDRCRPAMLRYRPDRYDVVIRAQSDSERVPNLKQLRAFRPLAIDLDFACFDRRRSERSRFEEARGPQPFVQAHPYQLV